MTVKELILELVKYDPELEVLCRNSEGDRGSLKEVRVTKTWFNPKDVVMLETDI